jgi:1-acyl-sn-glycerol-3-phosphate acyltransferase
MKWRSQSAIVARFGFSGTIPASFNRRFSSMHSLKYTLPPDLLVRHPRPALRVPPQLSRAARDLWWHGLRAYFALCQNVTIQGRENLPGAPPFILAANHQSHLDALLLASALPAHLRESVSPLAAGDTFFKSPAARIFCATALNALPLWRRHAGRHALAQLRHRLIAEPCSYILFPEGTRSRTGEMGKFRPGVGMLVAGTNVPILPCHIAGTFAALPPHRTFPRRATITLRIGKPLHFSHLPNHRSSWNDIARQLEQSLPQMDPAAI